MQVLHLLSNFKWTGPSDPAVTLAAGLRAVGEDVEFRCSGYTKGSPDNLVASNARQRGLDPLTDLHLSKHRSRLRDRDDVRRLRRILEESRFDVVHTHLANDFRIAARARPGDRPPIVRSVYDTEPDRMARDEPRRIARHADAVLVFSRRMGDHLQAAGAEPQRVHRIEPIVDLDRFDPARPLPDMRSALGFSSDHFVAGVVARVQPHRRFDLLLDMAESLAREIPEFRLVIVGRGSKLEAVARGPARERGLLDRSVFFPGYLSGDDYAGMLRALDVKLFLVPGTDGTARAVREALASGRPVVATARGMLPELIRDGETGLIVEERFEALANALFELHRQPDRRGEMGRQARKEACRRFDPAKQVATVRQVYGGFQA